MKKVILFYHGGSKNHGCEAIVRGTAAILKGISVTLCSFNIKDDQMFKLDEVARIFQQGPLILHQKTSGNNGRRAFRACLQHALPSILSQFIRNLRIKRQYKFLLREQKSLFLSIGGDNYCYGTPHALFTVNRLLSRRNKTILWGCSIEPKDIQESTKLRQDLNRYALITARESLTFQALCNNGINKNTHLFPDPAFAMAPILPEGLPAAFIPHNTVGINLSPMVQHLEQGGNITFKNFVHLVQYLLDNTTMNVAFIPHVIWENNNDLEPLSQLYELFKKTGRVCLIDKLYNAPELKGIISQCRFMVAARTHASIAAYSTQVPTLVIGYSVKARGIARDIFGTEDGYVLPVQGLQREDEVTQAFVKLMQNETQIRQHYQTFMPGYIAKTYQAENEIKKLLD